MLKILRNRLLPQLPASYKTLLGTSSAKYIIKDMEDKDGGKGQFTYFGVASGIKRCFNLNEHKDNKILLIVGVDGMQLFLSSNEDLWPILGKVFSENDIYEPFCIALFLGKCKPKSVDKYLEEFIKEMNTLLEEGLIIENKHFEIEIKCFVCDTPARSFLKGTKGHGGYYACERCTIKGKRVKPKACGDGKKGVRTVYPSADEPLRTDRSFRKLKQPEHHKIKTPLLSLKQKCNLIALFVLDFMHLGSGVMKRLLEFWMKGPLITKLSVRERLKLSERIKSMKKEVPVEFQRKPRSLKFLPKWTASEFMFFLLYSGPIVLKNILTPRLYQHFLLLHVACRILCDKEFAVSRNSIAKHYLVCFFKLLKYTYGTVSQIMNMHNLIHLADDAKNMGCSLKIITAFPFENFLGKLKRLVRSGNHALAQLCRRLHEKAFVQKQKPASPSLIEMVEYEPKGEGTSIKTVKYKSLTISTSSPNDIIMLEDTTIIKINKIFKSKEINSLDKIILSGYIWDKKKSIFEYPQNSSDFYMWQLKEELSRKKKIFFLRDVDRKMVILSLTEDCRKKSFAIPLLHH